MEPMFAEPALTLLESESVDSDGRMILDSSSV